MSGALTLLVAVLLDYRIGDPQGWPHPIIAIGRWVKILEKALRKMGLDNRLGGVLLWLGTTGGTVAVLTAILYGASIIHPYVEAAVTVYFLFASLAATSLKTEVMKVTKALNQGDLAEGRQWLSWLVGRDTAQLTQEEVIKGAVETVAENTIDGVLAPLMFILLGLFFGCPVQMVFLYKAVNTLDSMVGYIQEPYTRMGWFSAMMDDGFNLIPARVGSVLMLMAGGVLGMDLDNGRKVFKRDHGNHKSPNAGWPESVVAGLLNIQLGGTHTYFGEVLEKPTIGDAHRPATAEDIHRTTKIMYMAEFILLWLGIVLLMMTH